eukprot:8909492-Pyramimonas_sp.AAC.1
MTQAREAFSWKAGLTRSKKSSNFTEGQQAFLTALGSYIWSPMARGSPLTHLAAYPSRPARGLELADVHQCLDHFRRQLVEGSIIQEVAH